MGTTGPRAADRVEALIAAVDSYEPSQLPNHEDAFRVFARFVSRNIDAHYLERHPPSELLPVMEHILKTTLQRPGDSILVNINLSGDTQARRGVLVTCMPDQPFTYSVTRMALEQLGIRTYRSVTAVVPVRRDSQGVITTLGSNDVPKEAFAWIEVEAKQLAQRKTEIENLIRSRLDLNRSATVDFPQIRQLMTHLATSFDTMAKDRPDHRMIHEDNARFLRWLLDEHFVVLGTHYLSASESTPAFSIPNLGVGRIQNGMTIEEGDRAVVEAGGIPPFLWIRKSRSESWIYRPGRLDHILVQCHSKDGRPAGIVVIEGLFSYQALAEPCTDIPLLDRVIEQLFAQLSATKGSHRYRTIRNAFNSLPLEYLFALQIDDVRQLVERVLQADTDRRLQVHISTDETQNTAFVFVAIPRSQYSDELRADIRRLLKETFRASSVDDGVYAGESEAVTFHYHLTGATLLDAKTESSLKTDIEQLASPWADRLNDELTKKFGVTESQRLHDIYSEAFPLRYQEETSIARAVQDIEIIERIKGDGRFDCDIYREKVDEPLGITRLRLFESQNILLSTILPTLDNFGLVIIDQFPTTVHAPGRSEQVIATFRIRGVQDSKIDVLSRAHRLRDGIRAVVAGAMADDSLNRLLLRADIPWTYVILIRAYEYYARQLGLPYGTPLVRDVLLRHSDIVRALTEFFRAKFDPDFEGLHSETVDDKRLAVVDRARRAVLSLLEGIEDLTSDQILRTFFNLAEATVRTNFYSDDKMKHPHVVLKFDPSRIERMPEPRPFREIYVHHPLVTGVHLRGGPVARGGIRWSDRAADFRTEILGLMSTQNLKNVLIVPRGAKGGFVLRQPPPNANERRIAADLMYRIFISGLLDVTDNLVDGNIVTPKRVLRYDDLDHYLVVAADKGTAHLSDAANEIAVQRGFWLGDAFASGGSNGYDHKKEAITARGAWECVKRHFKEIAQDPEKDPIRVVGIGDMSGDVFGNGMLLSRSMRLVAAFDHRHIFIDPNPDPTRSFTARQKLFEKSGSSWEDFPRDSMSPGSGIYPRRAKSIVLSKEAQAALGITQETVSGQDLVHAILRAPVDLLWNGGIGTYVKATNENHLDVGDPTNDSVRVNASEIRAKVIGEGGNLGITQAARVELASQGVRLNTDALDNSAGVDLSDHEVNIKILFDRPYKRGQLTQKNRDQLLVDVKADVCRMVLYNNWVQSRMLSLDVLRSRRDLARFQRTMVFLAERVGLKSQRMQLPGERTLQQRQQRNEGLYRPELAVLAAHAKLDLRVELAKDAALTRDELTDDLLAYFPELLHKKHLADIHEHPLGADIGRTILTNIVLGDAGSAWLSEITLRTGRTTADIIRAHLAAAKLLNAHAMKAQIRDIENIVAVDVEYRLRLAIEDALEKVCLWFLRRGGEISATFAQAFAQTIKLWPQFSNVAQADSISLVTELTNAKIAPPLSDSVVALQHVETALDIAWISGSIQKPISDVIAWYTKIGEATGLLQLLLQQSAHPAGETDDLDSTARYALVDQLRRQLNRLVITTAQTEKNADNMTQPTAQAIRAMAQELAPLSGGRNRLSQLVLAVDHAARHVQAINPRS